MVNTAMQSRVIDCSISCECSSPWGTPGPTASVGEGIFYEMSEKGDLLRVIYPYPVKGASDPIYYSHPGWRQDGAKVAYFGFGHGPAHGGSGKGDSITSKINEFVWIHEPTNS